MPEGDTVHKLAIALSTHLVGRTPRRVELKNLSDRRLAGQLITSVSARGKHLFIQFEQGLSIRSHLGLYGSWHRYAQHERWKKPSWQASVVLDIEEQTFVCFNAKEIEIVRAGGIRERTLETRLAIDLAAPDADLAAIPKRAREFVEAANPVADLLLDQRVACGIGNVYKCEVLFLHGVHPLVPLAALTDRRLLELYRTAADLLRKNLANGPRVTRFHNDAAGVLWVYRRSGLPCFHCTTPVQFARLGRDGRATYWCPRCQPDVRPAVAPTEKRR